MVTSRSSYCFIQKGEQAFGRGLFEDVDKVDGDEADVPVSVRDPQPVLISGVWFEKEEEVVTPKTECFVVDGAKLVQPTQHLE